MGLAEAKAAAAVKAKNTALQTVDDLTKQLGEREKEKEEHHQLMLHRADSNDAKPTEPNDDPGNGRDLVAELVLVSPFAR